MSIPPIEKILIPIDPLNPSEEESCCGRIFLAYQRGIRAFCEYLGDGVGKFVVSYMLSEPVSVLRAVIEWLIYGWGGEPHFSGANPKEITEEQRRFNPVLCLHGNCHSPSAFTSIAAALQKDPDYRPAVFTVSLRGEEDTHIINEKMAEIRKLFGEDVEIDLIGHSRGAFLAEDRAGMKGIGRIVLLGQSYASIAGNNKYFSIHGTYDNLIGQAPTQRLAEKALKNPQHIHMVRAGHVGLLYTAGPKIVEWLKPAS